MRSPLVRGMRPARRGTGMSESVRNPNVTVGVGVLPLLQRRTVDPDDGPRRSGRARNNASTTSRSSSSTTDRRTVRLPVLEALSTEVPELRIVRHETNRGYGGALISGFAAATRPWVFYTDGDAQYDASELVRCIDAVEADTDIVQGWKIGRGDQWYRKVIGRAYHHVVRLLFRLPVRDTDCDFRLIRRTLLDRVELTSTSGRDLRRDDAQVRRGPVPGSSRSASAIGPARSVARSSSGSRRSPDRWLRSSRSGGISSCADGPDARRRRICPAASVGAGSGRAVRSPG